MAENKKSFVLYCDLMHTVEKLPNEIAGELFKHVLRYVNDQNPTTQNVMVDVCFEHIKQQLKRDLRKYEKRAENSRTNGKLGGRPTKPKKPNGLKNNPDEPKKPDSVNVSDSVSDNVSVSVNDKKEKKVFTKGVHDCFKQILKSFPDHLHPKKGKPTNNWLDTIDKLERIDNIPLQTIVEITKKTRADDFWSKNFMSITKLRKTNGDGIPYIVVFNEKFKSNGQNNQNGANQNGYSIEQDGLSGSVRKIMGR